MAAIATPTPTDVWRKPRGVTIAGGYLVADVHQELPYPILDAAEDGRALHELIDARIDDAVCAFTSNWGFLHVWFERGRRDRFPLARFRLKQQYFLALAQLGTAIRQREDPPISAALLAVMATKAKLAEHARTAAPRDPGIDAARAVLGLGEQAYQDDWASRDLTPEEQTLADQGVPTPVLWQVRIEHTLRQESGERAQTVSLPEYGARTLASELSAGLQYRLRPEWRTTVKGRRQHGYWTFEEIPLVYALEHVLLWTVRSRYHVLHHYFCEGCGKPTISWRADARFCPGTCGTRTRVARWRERKRKEKERARERRRRPARSARSTQRPSDPGRPRAAAEGRRA